MQLNRKNEYSLTPTLALATRLFGLVGACFSIYYQDAMLGLLSGFLIGGVFMPSFSIWEKLDDEELKVRLNLGFGGVLESRFASTIAMGIIIVSTALMTIRYVFVS